MSSVDVVIPNYQHGRYLGQCVSSVQAQGIGRLRILIIDNASSDDSVDIACQLASEDSRIEVRARSENLGFCASVNEGIDWATGDYVMVLCADDLLPPGSLARAMVAMEEHPQASFAYGAYAMYTEGKDFPDSENDSYSTWTVVTGTEFITQFCRNIIFVVAPLVRTCIQKNVGYYRPELPHNSDLEILLRLARFGDVAATPAIQSIQRLHGANISRASWADPVLALTNNLALFDSFFLNEGKDMSGAAHLHKRARRNVGEEAYWKGMSYMLRRQPRIGINLLKFSALLAPANAIVPPLGHLARVDHPLRRITRVVSQMGGNT
jgi:glycosyltransferase involved in cell wall biosynthesis